MKPNFYFKLCIFLLPFFISASSNGQLSYCVLDSCNAFLKGSYIEVGVNTNGAYGSSVNAPKGYHPKGGASVGDVCYKTCPTSNLGFVADPDKDGWTVGSPYPYYGDYFLPGDPQEGWSIEINGSQVNAWNGNGGGCGYSSYPYSGSGLSGKNISVGG